MSVADVQSNLLAEIEDESGEGIAAHHVERLEAVLKPMYNAMSKNAFGNLGHAHVRYLLHRYFVTVHGWYIQGLDPAGSFKDDSSPLGMMKDQVPSYIQEVFEKRLGQQGLGLHEIVTLAATIEHLTHQEAVGRLGDAFRLQRLLPTGKVSEAEADEILDTYMMSFILGENLKNMSITEVKEMKEEMPNLYGRWPEARELAHGMLRNTSAQLSASKDGVEFAAMASTVERTGAEFTHFQDKECKQLKAKLLSVGDLRTGRVDLADFYKPINGTWQGQDSADRLRELGVLDESIEGRPRVVIANYIGSPSNCLTTSSFYSVCCIDECEGLLGYLEERIVGPGAEPQRIADLVAGFSSQHIAQRNVSSILRRRLDEIAQKHKGIVPIHGILFAQWMHHAFPHECEYPYVPPKATAAKAATTKAAAVTTTTVAPAQQAVVEHDEEELDIPWLPEEELFTVRHTEPPTMQSNKSSGWRQLGLFACALGMAFFVVKGLFGEHNHPTLPLAMAEKCQV